MKRYLSAIVAICLGGMGLALLGLFLTPQPPASYASPGDAPYQTADVLIDVQAADVTVLADSVITYTVLYTNNYGLQVDGVIISSTLSRKQYYTLTHGFLSSPTVSTGNFTYTGGFETGYIVEWRLGSLDVGASGKIVITTTVPPEAEPPDKYSNRWPVLAMTAAITTSTAGVGGSEDAVNVMVVGPVLDISKDGNPVRPGQLLTYTLTVENQDRDDVIPATGLVITDAVPEDTEFVSGSGLYVLSSTVGGDLVVWHLPDPLVRGETVAVSFTVQLTHSFDSCPPDDIQNLDFEVSSIETIRTVDENLSIDVDDVLQKVIETPSLPSDAKAVFPGGIVTYTISVYNPLHDQVLAGVRLTDTLPGTWHDDPNPFVFQGMINGDAPAVISGSLVIWENLSVDAGDVTTLSFSAQVPDHIDIGSGSKKYPNSLDASAPGVVLCPMAATKPSQANVTTQIDMDKDVEPDHVLSGELVTYTITLENKGDTPINYVRLTDTLPSEDGADFYFVDMVSGPDPVIDHQHNPVVWYPLSVPASGVMTFSFRARAIGDPLRTYRNNLYAGAPETTIPDRTGKAPVTIDSPLAIAKVVDPDTTFANDKVQYTITVCNVATGTYTLDYLTDVLPAGVLVDGASTYEHDIPAESIGPDECWGHSFEADVTLDVGCATLARTIRNGRIDIEITSPVVATFYDEGGLAPLQVVPHVTIEKVVDHDAVLQGETLVYSITLSNGLVSDPIDQVEIVDTLFDGFEFVEMVPAGVNDPVDTDPAIRWTNQTVPAAGNLVLAFRARVPTDMPPGTYRNEVEATTILPVCIEDIDPTARVEVVHEIVKFTKDANPEDVPQKGVVQYEIKLENIDSVGVDGVIVTETLPSELGQAFEFLGMVGQDPEPSEINGREVVWRDLVISGGGTLRLRFEAQTAIHVLTYNNHVTAWCPRSEEITPQNPWDVWAPVNVGPGMVVEKTVFPTQTTIGKVLVYTITLNNQSSERFNDVRITDTLPSGFIYQQTRIGPPPKVQAPPMVVWEVAQVNKTSVEEIVYLVAVGPNVVSGTLTNKVEGYSPSGFVPGTEAEVKVTPGETWLVYLPVVLRSSPQ